MCPDSSRCPRSCASGPSLGRDPVSSHRLWCLLHLKVRVTSPLQSPLTPPEGGQLQLTGLPVGTWQSPERRLRNSFPVVGLLVRSNLLWQKQVRSCFRSEVGPWHSPALLCSELPGPRCTCATPHPPGLTSLPAPGWCPGRGKSSGETFYFLQLLFHFQ